MTNSNSLIQKARQLRKELALTMSDGYIASKGGWLKVFITQSSVIQNIYYGLRVDLLIHKFGSHWNKWINEELSKNLTKEELNNKEFVDNIKKDINNCYKQIKSNPFDYFFFDLRNKTKEERAKFATDIWMLSTLSRKRGLRKMHDIELNEKYNFYKLTKEYFKREVIPVTATNYQEFEQYTLRHKRVIAKSTYEACGKSIYIFEVNSKEDAKKEYDRIISYGGSYILEELIIQHPEMAKWNESSVNTVRIITIHNSTEANVLLAFMRAGRKGSAVDNGGTGGIFATIDINTGKIVGFVVDIDAEFDRLLDEGYDLKDIDIKLDIDENGKNALENAYIKAKAYYDATKMITIGIDNNLFIEELPAEKQPGNYVRRINGKELSDEEMIEHYTGLVKEYGEKLTCKWVYGMVFYNENGIVLSVGCGHFEECDVGNIFEFDGYVVLRRKENFTRKENFAVKTRNSGFLDDNYTLYIYEKNVDIKYLGLKKRYRSSVYREYSVNNFKVFVHIKNLEEKVWTLKGKLETEIKKIDSYKLPLEEIYERNLVIIKKVQG